MTVYQKYVYKYAYFYDEETVCVSLCLSVYKPYKSCLAFIWCLNLVITVSTDALASNGARASAGTVLIAKLDMLFQKSQSGSCLNIKMLSYQHWDSHYKDKAVWWPSHLYKGNSDIIIRKDTLYIETVSRSHEILSCHFICQLYWVPHGAVMCESKPCVFPNGQLDWNFSKHNQVRL